MHVAADLALLGMTTVEYQAIAAFDRPVELGTDAAPGDVHDASDEYAAMPRVAPDDQCLVPGSFEKPRGQSVGRRMLSAGKDLCQRTPLPGVQGVVVSDIDASAQVVPDLIQGRPVGPDRCHHIFRTLEAAFDLETVDARPDQAWKQRQCHQVLRRQQVSMVAPIAWFTIDHQTVGEATGLRALAAVGRTTAPGLAGKTLSAVADTQCAMHEHLDLERAIAYHSGNFINRQFASQDDAADAKSAGKRHARDIGDRHLGAAVDRQPGCRLPGQTRQPDVLHDQRIDPSLCGSTYQVLGALELFVKDQGIEGEVAADTAFVQVVHGRGQRVHGKRGGAYARVEAAVQAEIHGIGAGPDRRFELGPPARRRKDLGFAIRRKRVTGGGVHGRILADPRPAGRM